MSDYDHRKLEPKWQKVWAATKLYTTKSTKGKKSYVLDMFPYPSGDGLHVGHPKGYIATDVYSRLKKMQGHNILHPMGWDAFGLPAENYAIKNKIHPAIAVKKNIKRFKEQLGRIGFNYDWSREITTTDPNYYRWTQWIFLQMFHAGLAYESREPINWCPSCKTGLANEDLEDGKCERCGSIVEKRPIPQWVLRITKYADRLLSDLDTLNWPEYIKESQRNWIGRSEGVNLEFRVKGTNVKLAMYDSIPQTYMAQTFTIIAPEHPLAKGLAKGTPQEKEVLAFIERIKEKKAKGGFDHMNEMEGVFTGRYIEYPPAGRELPIWVASYAVADYGTGIVNCSAHDERDFAFAKKYNIPLHPVLFPADAEHAAKVKSLEVFYREPNGVLSEPKEFKGRRWDEAREGIIEHLIASGWGQRKVNYKLRDWVFSRQRYWGEPIPLVFCEDCKKRVESLKFKVESSKSETSNLKLKTSNLSFSLGEALNPGWIAVPENELPVKLPAVESYEPTGTGESPLAAIPKFVQTTCPKCGGPAKRETNTMPQWAGSCWYYLRYTDPKNNKRFASLKAEKYWSPVDMYVGGAEHATRHLIYARFWHKFLFDIKAVSTSEPFTRLQNVGLILASDGRKMSKRFGNVVNPDEIVDRFGADSLRVYEMFMGPFNQAIAWNTDSLVGARRFLERVWKLRFKIKDVRVKKGIEAASDLLTSDNLHLKSLLHQTIKKVGDDIEAFRFNTAVSSLMILLNALEKETEVSKETYRIFLKLVAPLAPHLSEELWAQLGYKKSIHAESWPQYDERIAVSAPITIIVQVNGKTRATFTTNRGDSKESLEAAARALPPVKKWIEGKVIPTVIVVPDRLVNIVVKNG